jgi:hypothetical protein
MTSQLVGQVVNLRPIGNRPAGLQPANTYATTT